LYENLLIKTFRLEDIIASYGSDAGYIRWSFDPQRTHKLAGLLNAIEFYWRVYVEPWAMKLLFLSCAVMSVILVWSEVTFFSLKPVLSIFALLVNIDRISDLTLQIIVFVSVTYVSVCAYSSLFRLRLFNYYRLIEHQQTDSNSLLFSASYLNRLTAPIVFNFLFMIHNQQTAYFAAMGDGKLIPIFGYSFQKFFPMLVLIVCLATLFNVYSRLLKCLNITRFQFDEDFSHHQIDEGRDIIARARKQRSRMNSEDDTSFYRLRSRPKVYANARPELQNSDTPLSSKIWSALPNRSNVNNTEIELPESPLSTYTNGRYSRVVPTQEIL